MLKYANSQGCAQLVLELRKELKAVVFVGVVEFHHNPFGMCATGNTIAILNDFKSNALLLQ